MREILFRGKRKDNGEWVQGDLLLDQDLEQAQIVWFDYKSTEDGVERDGDGAIVIPETVGQYIGLYDKNSKKIFEGDIIKGKVHEMNGYRVRRGVVEYHGVGFIMNLDPNSWYDQKNISFDCEIIGNIYDNPELLKDGVKND